MSQPVPHEDAPSRVIPNLPQRQICFDDAARLLTMRLHSRSELQRKLLRKKHDPAVVESILEDLTRLGYVNDARFALTKAGSAARHKHHGRRRAVLELHKAGVRGDVATRALDEVYAEQDSTAVARELARKQLPRLKKLDPAVARRRLTGMLQRRGFDFESIRPVLDEMLGGHRTDVD